MTQSSTRIRRATNAHHDMLWVIRRLCASLKISRHSTVEGGDKAKQTDEIATFIPLLNNIDIQGKDITTDALLTQRKFTSFVVERKAHYHFMVKGNQAMLKNDIALLFANRKKADFVEITPPNHGRIEIRRI